MASLHCLLSPSPVLGPNNLKPMLSFRHGTSTLRNDSNLVPCNSLPNSNLRSKKHSFGMGRVPPMSAMSRGGKYGIKFDDESKEDPFWVEFVKATIRSLKVLLAFLVQQPGQLKYIEWPSFQDTLRTATLTLVLVGFLIVALATLDSGLSFVLALLIRKPG